MAEGNQQAATAVKQDTTNIKAQSSHKTMSFLKIIEYLAMRMATLHALGGMEPTLIHGASGINIASKPMVFNKNARRKRLLLPPASPPLVSVASVETPSIPAEIARLWAPSSKTAMRPTSSGEQPHTRSLCRYMASP